MIIYAEEKGKVIVHEVPLSSPFGIFTAPVCTPCYAAEAVGPCICDLSSARFFLNAIPLVQGCREKSAGRAVIGV
jgi:hypothetical protein